MGRGVLTGALVGIVQGLVAVLLVTSLGDAATDVGWFAYAVPGDTVVVPGPPVVRREWLLVPLVPALLGAAAGALAGRGRDRGRTGRRRVAVTGAAGLVVGAVAVALDDGVVASRGYADYLPVTSTAPGLVLLVGSVVGAAVLVALAGLAVGCRWGVVGTVLAVVLGVVGVVAQLAGDGLDPPVLAGEVAALVLLGAAVALSRQGRATRP